MASEDGCIQSKKFQSVNIRNIRSDDILLNNDSDIPIDGSFNGMINIKDKGTNVDNFLWRTGDESHNIKAGKTRVNYCLIDLETDRDYTQEPNNIETGDIQYLKVPSILKIKIPEGGPVPPSKLDAASLTQERKDGVNFLYKTNINAIDIENADIKFQQTTEDKELIKEQKIKKKTSHLKGNNFSIVIENEDKTNLEEDKYTKNNNLSFVKVNDLPDNCLKLHNELGYIELKSEIHSRGEISGSSDVGWNLPNGVFRPSGHIEAHTTRPLANIKTDHVSYSQVRMNGEIITSIKVRLKGVTYNGSSNGIFILGSSGSYIAKYETSYMGLLYRYTINVVKPEDGTYSLENKGGNLMLAFGGNNESGLQTPGSATIIPSSATLGQIAPTEIDTLTAEGGAGDVVNSGSDMHLANGTFKISGKSASIDPKQFIIGTQLAITIKTIVEQGDISGQSGTAAVGDVYFATVTSNATGTSVLSMKITNPTTLTGKSFTGIQDTGTPDNMTAKIRIVTGDTGIKLDLHKKGSMTEINNFVNDYTTGENLFTSNKYIYLATNDYVYDPGLLQHSVIIIKLYGYEESSSADNF